MRGGGEVCVCVGGVDWIKQWRRMRKNILDTDNLLWEITDHIHAFSCVYGFTKTQTVVQMRKILMLIYYRRVEATFV